jgi:PEP-CTERM motif
MTRQTISAALLSIAAAFCITAPAHADIIVTIDEYNGNFYDFQNFFPSNPINIGAFTFDIPAGVTIYGGTVSSTFGNNDVFPDTALSDYYVDTNAAGTSADNTNVEVAECDNPAALCYNSQDNPTPWSYSFTAQDLDTISSALVAGQEDTLYFYADQNSPYTLQTGVITLDLSTTPEPSTVFIMCGGLAGIALLRRARKV